MLYLELSFRDIAENWNLVNREKALKIERAFLFAGGEFTQEKYIIILRV